MIPPRLFIAMICLTLMSSGAFADVINVPGDYPTIQGAVDAASNGDEIVVAPGTYTSTHPAHVVDLMGKGITLRSSNGPEKTIIDGEGIRRGVVCWQGEPDSTNIQGFTITNGNSTSYDYNGDGSLDYRWEESGCGVMIHAASPTITNCIIRDNKSNGLNGINSHGGGISCYQAAPSIINCTISNNVCRYGAGIYAWDSTLNIIDSTISSNTTPQSVGSGIGIYSTGCELICTNTEITDNFRAAGTYNFSSDNGAGIYCEIGSLRLTECTISGNRMGEPFVDEKGAGGGIYCQNTQAIVENCIICDNSAYLQGGGIYIGGSSLTLSGSSICNNQAYDGGGVLINHNTFYQISDCQINDNTANSGAGLYSQSNLSSFISDSDISGNKGHPEVSAITFHEGIGLRVKNTNISNCTITNNVAEVAYGLARGAGISCYDSLLIDCQITNNMATSSFLIGGSGIEASNSTLRHCVISDNTAVGKNPSYSGDGVRASDCMIDSCIIRDNVSTNSKGPSEGAGLSCSSSTLINTIICGNSPIQIRGDWTDEGDSCIALSCDDNDLDGIPDKCLPVGDGIQEVPAEYPDIQSAIDAAGYNDTILVSPGNWTGEGDSVINPRGKALTIRSTSGPAVTFLDGEGARRVLECTSGEIQSTSIEGFTLTNGNASIGGGIYCDDATPLIVNCHITGNTAENGAGVYSSAVLIDSVVCGNSPDQVYGNWIDGGNNCIAFNCQDANGDGSPDKCDDDIHEVPSEYATVQEAIEAAGYGDTVLVGPGTWTGNGNWVINPGGKSITIRSTDGPDVTILDGENQRRVVQCTGGESASTVLEGFTITNGNASSAGGIYLYYSSPTITNCRIIGNRSDSSGGGISLLESETLISNCLISENYADGSGGGIYCYAASPTISDCSISDNTAGDWGGGIYCNSSNLTISNCTIFGNNASSDNRDGGGIYISGGSLNITNCTISGNMAGRDGGGIHLSSSVSGTISGCTLSENVAGEAGGGLHHYYYSADKLIVTNCRFEFNQAGEDGGGILSGGDILGCEIIGNSAGEYGGGIFYYQNSFSSIENCLIDGNTALYGGGINFPQFNEGLVIGCTIQNNIAEAGAGILSKNNSNPRLSNTVVCGNETEQIEGDWTDNGGNTVEDECPLCPGDATGDGYVDVNDVLYLISAWDTADPNADFDEDGLVDADDVLILLSNFGESCP